MAEDSFRILEHVRARADENRQRAALEKESGTADSLTGGTTELAQYANRVKEDAFTIASTAADIVDALPAGPIDGTGEASSIARDLEDISRDAAKISTYVSTLVGQDAVATGEASIAISDAISNISRKTDLRFPIQATVRDAAVPLLASIKMTLGDLNLAYSSIMKILMAVESIRRYITSNPITLTTLQYAMSTNSDFLLFFVDLIEPLKRFTPSNWMEGMPSTSSKSLNRYNELDMEVQMNRHAMICQFQRLIKSVANVLQSPSGANLSSFIMDTSLRSDLVGEIESEEEGKEDFRKSETWLFINGIAGEMPWLRLACNKLGDKFKRKVRGIFNESDGILWDLLECAGERSVDAAASIAERTTSSIAAQGKLRDALINTLMKDDMDKIVVIAHSQGCLLLRLALEELQLPQYSNLRERMKKRLRVFTFGNPSLDWNVSNYCHYTEHFANQGDFVAKLGVLKQNGGYGQPTFISENPGHLFGAQYSLERVDYGRHENCDGNSRLLNCAGGNPFLD